MRADGARLDRAASRASPAEVCSVAHTRPRSYGGVELVVDSQDEVAERDETNNRLTGYVPIP